MISRRFIIHLLAKINKIWTQKSVFPRKSETKRKITQKITMNQAKEWAKVQQAGIYSIVSDLIPAVW